MITTVNAPPVSQLVKQTDQFIAQVGEARRVVQAQQARVERELQAYARDCEGLQNAARDLFLSINEMAEETIGVLQNVGWKVSEAARDNYPPSPGEERHHLNGHAPKRLAGYEFTIERLIADSAADSCDMAAPCNVVVETYDESAAVKDEEAEYEAALDYYLAVRPTWLLTPDEKLVPTWAGDIDDEPHDVENPPDGSVSPQTLEPDKVTVVLDEPYELRPEVQAKLDDLKDGHAGLWKKLADAEPSKKAEPTRDGLDELAREALVPEMAAFWDHVDEASKNDPPAEALPKKKAAPKKAAKRRTQKRKKT